MNENYNVSSSPHIRDKVTSSNIMLMVVISLLPATFFGIWNFRHENAWILIVLTTAAAVLAEYLWEKLMHKPVTIKDFSAVVTGLASRTESSSDTSVVDGGCRCFLCDHCCKAALRRTGTEFHEPGSWCTLLSSDLLCRKDDKFCIRRSYRTNSSGESESR